MCVSLLQLGGVRPRPRKRSGLHSFIGPEGVFPTLGVVRDSAGNLYGATVYGGIYGNCDNELGGGSVYQIDIPQDTQPRCMHLITEVTNVFPTADWCSIARGTLWHH